MNEFEVGPEGLGPGKYWINDVGQVKLIELGPMSVGDAIIATEKELYEQNEELLFTIRELIEEIKLFIGKYERDYNGR